MTFLKKRVPLLVLIFNCLIVASYAQGGTCETATPVEVSAQYRVDSLSGGGAIFQGATSAAWYLLEPDEEGIVTIQACQSNQKTRLAVFQIEDCTNPGSATIINAAEQNCENGLSSFLEITVNAGQSYYIYWDDFYSKSGFEWHMDFSPFSVPQLGDICQMADTLMTGIQSVDTLRGNGAAFLDAVSAKWYVFTPDSDGWLSINSCNSAGVDTRLFVFEGGCTRLSIIGQDDNGCPDNHGARIEQLPITKGEVYRIYWDDHGSSDGFEMEVLFEVTTGVEHIFQYYNWQISPNPVAADYFTINLDQPDEKIDQILIINTLGQVIYQSEQPVFSASAVDVGSLPPGFYWVQIKIKDRIASKMLARI